MLYWPDTKFIRQLFGYNPEYPKKKKEEEENSVVLVRK
jgi:hypothetical protein